MKDQEDCKDVNDNNCHCECADNIDSLCAEDTQEDSVSDEQFTKLEQEHAALKESLLRVHAEIENMRKRTEKEKEDSLKFANTKFAKELLCVIDSLDRALENAGDVETSHKLFFEGIKLTQKEILSAFSKNGITKIEVKKSDEFDHNFHQIMCEVDSDDVVDGKIVNVYQNGYMINGRLLRPVLVSVAKKK